MGNKIKPIRKKSLPTVKHRGGPVMLQGRFAVSAGGIECIKGIIVEQHV